MNRKKVMKILAIESSALVASVALTEDDMLKAEFTINNKLTHSETLLPMLESMASIAGLDLSGVDAIAVSAGPGSFTGLRIGAATAKGLALAWNRPLIRVSTLHAMAYSLSNISDAVVCPLMDARRGQVYSAAYMADTCLIHEDARELGLFLEELKHLQTEKGRKFLFLGDGVPAYRDIISSQMDGFAAFADASMNRQRAAWTAVLGDAYYRRWLADNDLSPEAVQKTGADAITCFDQTVMNGDDFAPDYLRKSQAEQALAAGTLEDAGVHSLRKMSSGHPHLAEEARS